MKPYADVEGIERRYAGVARLARDLASSSDPEQLTAAVAEAVGNPWSEGETPPVRLWLLTSEGAEELARFPRDRRLPHVSQRDLMRAGHATEPIVLDGNSFVALRSGGGAVGVLEIDSEDADVELLADAAPLVACGLRLIGDVRRGDETLAGDAAALMAGFAAEAKRTLEHDRLSAYLLTCDGRAFERFAVATSAIISGEGVIIPFEDVGLRHVVVTNRPLVSQDLANDPRIVGREDRIVARAGFHGLVSVPLRTDGRPFGVLNFVSRTPGFYSDRDITTAQQIADQVAGFIGNLRVQDRTRALIRHQATESERARVARDVYQVVGTMAPALRSIADSLEHGGGTGSAVALDGARRLRELVDTEVADIRRSVAGLMPRALDSQNLAEAITASLGGFASPTTRFTLNGDPSQLSRAANRAAYRIFQEAVANSRLHADATMIDVTLTVDRDLELIVHDDGVGFDVDEGAPNGIGIPFMRERAQALGGMLTIDSSRLAGTTVMFQLMGVRDAEENREDDHVESVVAAPASLRVFLTEPPGLGFAGLTALLDQADGVRVVGAAQTIDEAADKVPRLHPDVVLLDARICGVEFDAPIAELATAAPAAALVVLIEQTTRREAEFIDAGATGVVPRSVSGDELVDAIRAVARGAKLTGFRTAEDGAAVSAGLSSRERAVLTLMTAGRTNAEIGATLYLATKTVERQVATIIRRLGARNRTHAGAIAVAHQLVAPSELDV